MVLQAIVLLLAAGSALAQQPQPGGSKEIFSRAAIMARGLTVGPSPRPLVEIQAQQQGKSVGVLVSEDLAELKKQRVVRNQLMNPDGEAKPGEYPWMVAFEAWDQLRQDWVQFCGGTIIAPRIVLTAAHCTRFPLEFVRVVVQAVVLDKSSAIRYYRASTVETHPNFDRIDLKLASGQTLKGLVNDFAIFVLSEDPSVKPVRLTSAPTKKDVFAYRSGRALGWGVTSARRVAPRLLFIDVPIIDDTECGKAYSPLQRSMLCAGIKRGGKDTCQGDSGGPLVVESESKELQQAAVISFGEGCGVPEYYGIYSSVTEGRKWIEERLAVKR